MENKYYTPEIEEFHVGFELTYIHLSKRINHIIKEDDFTYGDHQGATDFYEILKNKPLVKYLDREDIESLGWEIISFDKEIDLIFKKEDMELYYNIENRVTMIYLKANDWTGCIFTGNIKNKSELKVLLKQLSKL